MWALIRKLWSLVVALSTIIEKIDDILTQVSRIFRGDDEEDEDE